MSRINRLRHHNAALAKAAAAVAAKKDKTMSQRTDAIESGKAFMGCAAASGLVLPIYSATAQLFGLWNPVGSGVIAYLLNLRMTLVDTTGAAGGFCWGLLPNAGSQLGTAAPISAFTEQLPYRLPLTGAQGGNRCRFSGSAITVTTALMVPVWQTGLNQLVLTPATTGAPAFSMTETYNDDLCIGPGGALFLSGNIATLSKWVPSVSWYERPAP